ncbi:MAG: hypothetical protein QQN41_07310 [Nitrosopumilus sp.]
MCCTKNQATIDHLKTIAQANEGEIIGYKIVNVICQNDSVNVCSQKGTYFWNEGVNKAYCTTWSISDSRCIPFTPEYVVQTDVIKTSKFYSNACPEGIHVFTGKTTAGYLCKIWNDMNHTGYYTPQNYFVRQNKIDPDKKYVVMPVTCNIKNMITAGFSILAKNKEEAVFTEVTVTKKTWDNIMRKDSKCAAGNINQ